MSLKIEIPNSKLQQKSSILSTETVLKRKKINIYHLIIYYLISIYIIITPLIFKSLCSTNQ